MLTLKGFTAEKIQAAQVPGSGGEGGGDVEVPYDPTIFQYKWSHTNNTNGFSLSAPMAGVSPATIEIDWGDGSAPQTKTVTAAENIQHTYYSPLPSEDFITTIKLVSGDAFPYMALNNTAGKFMNGVTELLTPLPKMLRLDATKEYMPKLPTCPLLRSVCSRFFRNYEDVSDKLDFSGYFKTCPELVSIPANLFQNLKIYNFNYMFQGSPKLQIPAGLLYTKPELVVEGVTYNYQNFVNGAAVISNVFGKTEQEQKECLEYISSKSEITFNYMFSNCTGVAPRLWEYNYTKPVQHRFTFLYFNGENTSDIPEDWVTAS